jgi:hypothetical protein
MIETPEQYRLRVGLDIMQAEFESHQLEVVLVPSRRAVNSGGCIRVAAARNCDWYRRFCARHLSSRRRNKRLIDTRIKRRNVAALLKRLRVAAATRSKYADELRRIAAAIASGPEAAAFLAQSA